MGWAMRNEWPEGRGGVAQHLGGGAEPCSGLQGPSGKPDLPWSWPPGLCQLLTPWTPHTPAHIHTDSHFLHTVKHTLTCSHPRAHHSLWPHTHTDHSLEPFRPDPQAASIDTALSWTPGLPAPPPTSSSLSGPPTLSPAPVYGSFQWSSDNRQAHPPAFPQKVGEPGRGRPAWQQDGARQRQRPAHSGRASGAQLLAARPLLG